MSASRSSTSNVAKTSASSHSETPPEKSASSMQKLVSQTDWAHARRMQKADAPILHDPEDGP